MSAISSDPAHNPEKLSFFTKMAYGVGDLGPAILSSINGFFLNFFLLEIAGLRPAAAGTIFLIVKIWDAVNDPLVGSISDKTNTRWGRRRPWLLFGALPFGLAFFMQYLVPEWSDSGLFWYYLVVAFLLDMANTSINVPYAALTPELTRDYDERTSLSSYRFSFSILGGVFAAFFHTIIVDAAPDPRTGYMISAAIWGAMFTGSALLTFLGVRETHYLTEQHATEGPSFLEGLKITLSNRAFVLVALIYLTSWLAIQFVQNNLLLYTQYWMGAGEIFGTLVLALQVSNFVWVLIWTKVSERIGKKNIYYIGMSVWIVVSVALFFLQPGQVSLLYMLALLASVGVSVAYLVPWSMLPDVIEMDELQTGQRREGVFYGFFVFLQKLGLSLSLALANYTLELTGYINPETAGGAVTQPASVLLALRIFVSFAPMVILIISLFLVRAFPITRESHAAMRAELAARQASGAD